MRKFLFFILLWVATAADAAGLREVLDQRRDDIAKVSRASVDAILAEIIDTGDPAVPVFLERWQGRLVWQRKADGQLFFANGDGPYVLIDIVTGAEAGRAEKGEIEQLRPNAGVRGQIASGLVRFQLSDPDIARRQAALDAIGRSPGPEHLAALKETVGDETDAGLRDRKERLIRLLGARFEPEASARIAAIQSLSGDISVEARAVVSQILAVTPGVGTAPPEGVNLARVLEPGKDFPREQAYARLVAAGLMPEILSSKAVAAALESHIDRGTVGGVPLHRLSDPDMRYVAYDALAAEGKVPPTVSPDEADAAVDAHVFYELYQEPDPSITDAAQDTARGITQSVALNTGFDLALDAISLASIYFLAAIGLAITFGVMGVINMAHGEFIMMGAYTGYLVQQIVPGYTLSLVVALPLAFAVTFAAGVAMERLVIRWLYKRQLETLLATFGISIALQQLAKNIFGTQARPLTSPAWLDGELVLNPIVSISFIRIAIFVLAVMFLLLILYILRRTRLGLEVRAVTQNPGMAASMGINPDRINMLTFGLGSGIAGIAGVAIGLYAKVTSEMGSDYIVQSFMTVVVGGVGNVWGTLAGASLIGFLQKGIEWLNPSNTLAAQTYMILFIMLFIQFRPRGIVALKGRAAGD